MLLILTLLHSNPLTSRSRFSLPTLLPKVDLHIVKTENLCLYFGFPALAVLSLIFIGFARTIPLWLLILGLVPTIPLTATAAI